jgi:hypothetical protein
MLNRGKSWCVGKRETHRCNIYFLYGAQECAEQGRDSVTKEAPRAGERGAVEERSICLEIWRY